MDEETQDTVSLGHVSGQQVRAQQTKQRAISMITSVKALIHIYSSLKGDRASHTDVLAPDQLQDGSSTKLKEILRNQGRGVGTRVKRRLLEHVGEPEKESQGHFPPSENGLWTRFGAGAEDVNRGGEKLEKAEIDEVVWFKAAKSAKRGVKYLVKQLPEEDD